MIGKMDRAMRIKGMMNALFWGAACVVTGSIDLAALPVTIAVLESKSIAKKLKDKEKDADDDFRFGIKFAGLIAAAGVLTQIHLKSPAKSILVSYALAQVFSLLELITAKNPLEKMPLTSMILSKKNKDDPKPDTDDLRTSAVDGAKQFKPSSKKRPSKVRHDTPQLRRNGLKQ